MFASAVRGQYLERLNYQFVDTHRRYNFLITPSAFLRKYMDKFSNPARRHIVRDLGYEAFR
jgi:hypothetical protein